ncbi:hypothetical protein G6F36_008295 [Rhizopus arrhizus]|nr:hypothetical protein G6F36_008295 [Rhizopus arrhizus]
MHGESASVDITSENIQSELRKIEEILGTYDSVDIMNFDETGLYYQQTPRRTISPESLGDLKKLNVAFGRQNRKIALLLDNASVHKIRIPLNNIKLIFLLANTTSKLQALDAGIIDNFKAHFRAQQYDRALCLYISKKLDNPNVYKMDQAQAMFFLANAWLKVKPETINGMLPDLPRNFDNKVTDVSQLNLEADESEMIVCYTTSTTNNEETAEGNIDETEENDNTEQDEQCVDIVECKKRLREAYETILIYEVPLDDLDRKLHCRIRMRLADSCAELNVKRANRSSILFYKKVPLNQTPLNQTPLNRATTVIPNEIREQLNIEEGLLVAEIKNWCNLEIMIKDYFRCNGSYTSNELQLKDIVTTQKNSVSEYSVTTKDASFALPQPVLFIDYCKRIKAYLLKRTIKIEFLNFYKKCIQEKQEEEEVQTRQLQEQQQMDILAHKGTTNAFLAAEQGSIEINNSFNKLKRQSSFERVEADNAPNKKNKTDENSDEDMLEISFVSTSSGGSYLTDTSKTNDNDELVPYVLAFIELISLKSSDFESINYFSKHIGFEERFSNDGVLITEELSENFEIFIKKWSRSIQNKMNFFIVPTSPDQVQLLTTLNISYRHIIDYVKDDGFHEMNFKIKFVAPFLNNIIFEGITVSWDISPAIPNISKVKRITPDIIFKYYDLEIGIGEVKPLNASKEQVEEDRIRIAELLKKLLHIRMSKAKHINEFIVFRIMIFGETIEYYTMKYIEQQYIFCLHKTSVLPTLPTTFTHMSLSLEYLHLFKSMMLQSVNERQNMIENEHIIMNYLKDLKPTVTLLI